MTVLDLIKGSMKLIGAISPNETPTATESADALLSLNDMLESWSADGILIYQKTREVFPFTGGQATFTMGVSGDFNSTRPMQILGASVLSGTTETPLEVLDFAQWSAISDKSSQSTAPTKLYPDGAFPLKNMHFWPVPTEAGSVVIYSVKPLTAFATVNDVIALPPGYTRALRYNLAIDLAPEYGRDPSAIVAMTADESKTSLKRVNTGSTYMESDMSGMFSSQKSYNVMTGE